MNELFVVFRHETDGCTYYYDVFIGMFLTLADAEFAIVTSWEASESDIKDYRWEKITVGEILN
jgi:hypothetical protein